MARSLFVAVLCLNVSCVSGLAVKTEAEEPPRKKSITLAELQNLDVIGRLGHPLGAAITVEGIFADVTYTRLKHHEGKTLLRVSVVNGKKLPKEEVFTFKHFLEFDREVVPKPGDKFKYHGYETGGFIGIDQGPFLPRNGNVIGIAAPTHHFSTHFVVVNDEIKRE